MKTQPQIERTDSRVDDVTQRPNGRTTEVKIPESWIEVANIDFTAYVDRDCNERTIYKTPEGTLKADRKAPSSRTIEDVSREQVARWIHQCITPEEFEQDFVVNANFPNRMRAQDALGNAIHRTTAISEALAVIVSATEKAEHPLMSNEAVDGLMAIAMEDGDKLREAFEQLLPDFQRLNPKGTE